MSSRHTGSIIDSWRNTVSLIHMFCRLSLTSLSQKSFPAKWSGGRSSTLNMPPDIPQCPVRPSEWAPQPSSPKLPSPPGSIDWSSAHHDFLALKGFLLESGWEAGCTVLGIVSRWAYRSSFYMPITMVSLISPLKHQCQCYIFLLSVFVMAHVMAQVARGVVKITSFVSVQHQGLSVLNIWWVIDLKLQRSALSVFSVDMKPSFHG